MKSIKKIDILKPKLVSPSMFSQSKWTADTSRTRKNLSPGFISSKKISLLKER